MTNNVEKSLIVTTTMLKENLLKQIDSLIRTLETAKKEIKRYSPGDDLFPVSSLGEVQGIGSAIDNKIGTLYGLHSAIRLLWGRKEIK